jgi:hypothetical protein
MFLAWVIQLGASQGPEPSAVVNDEDVHRVSRSSNTKNVCVSSTPVMDWS